MPPSNNWRLALAHRIAAAYAMIPSAEIVMIAGSTGRGTADRFSDIEIDVYYSAWPTLAQRQAAVAACGADSAEYSTFEDSEIELAEGMYFGDFYAHSSTFLVAQMDRWAQAITVDGQNDIEGQMRLNSVLNAIPVTGHAQIARWQAAAQTYPDALVHQMLTDALDFERFYYSAGMVVERNDTLLLNKTLVQCTSQLMHALHAINHVYLPTPDALKWLDETIGALPLRPNRLATRLRQLFQVSSAEAVSLMRDLIDETRALVADHAPAFDLAASAESATHVRLPFDDDPTTARN